MLLNQLHAQKNAITALGRQFGARRIRVFGSVACGEIDPRTVATVIDRHLDPLETSVQAMLHSDS